MTTALAQQRATGNGLNQPTNFRYDIEGLRGLAILIVVTGHMFEQYGIVRWPDWLGAVTHFVAAQLNIAPQDMEIIHIHGGVDMSFALSGYLITRQLLNEFLEHGRISMKGFYARRSRRLLPAATLVTIATLAGAWTFLSPLRLRDIAIEAIVTSLPVPFLNYWLGYNSTDYFAADNVAKSPFQHYWSLNVEEQFYLVYPVLFLLALFIGRKIGKLRLTVGIMLAIIVGGSLTWSIIQTGTNEHMAYFGAHTRAWELGLGALAAVMAPQFGRLPKFMGAALTWLGLATILTSVLVIEHYKLPGFAVSAPVIGVLLVIIGGEAHPRRGAESVLRFRPLQYIGTISYQWYLWHWPVVICFPFIVERKLDLADMFIVAAVSFVLASATWHLIDAPIRRRKDFKEKPGKAISMGIHLMMAALAASIVLFSVAPGSSTTPATSKPSGHTAGFTPITTPVAPVTELSRLIEEGTQLKTLPAALDERVLAQVEEHDGVSDCLTSHDIARIEPCTVGNTRAAKSIAIVGDSHAREWKYGLEAIGQRRDVKVVIYAKQTCPAEPYVHVDRHYKTRYVECEKWREAAYQQIESTKPMAVILSSLAWDDMTAEAVTTAVKRFTSQGIKVVLLENGPRPSENIPECLAQYPSNVQKCTMDRARATYQPELRRTRKDAAITAGALFIDPMNWFCTASQCPAIVNGIVVYPDGYHISGSYAQWISPKLEAALAPVLN